MWLVLCLGFVVGGCREYVPPGNVNPDERNRVCLILTKNQTLYRLNAYQIRDGIVQCSGVRIAGHMSETEEFNGIIPLDETSFVAYERSNLKQVAVAAFWLFVAGLLGFHNISASRRRVFYNHAIVCAGGRPAEEERGYCWL